MSGGVEKQGLRAVIETYDPSPELNKDFLDRFNSLESLTFLDYPFLKQETKLDEGEIDKLLRNVGEYLEGKKFVTRNHHKLINDPVHGTIYVHPLGLEIMATKQFDRLHYVKQLSGAYYVYPSACHSRYEHSVGAYHLAGKLVNTIKDQQPELGITTMDAMCVQLAGLCHDIGHGPFSHVFDGYVVKQLIEKAGEKERKELQSWTHETASLLMVDAIWKTKRDEFKKWGFSDKEKEFIKAMIKNDSSKGNTGRGDEKSFLYEIVANEKSGMDVDKWDYLIRDSYHLGVKCAFEKERLFYHARVIGDGEDQQICYRDKEIDTIYTLFQTRYTLFKKVYHHPVVLGVMLQLSHALAKASASLQIGPEKKSLLECLDDMDAYVHLHDGILFKILESEGDEMKDARELLESLQKRQIWKLVGEKRIKDAEAYAHLEEALKQKLSELSESLKVQKVTRNFGQKEKNPLEKIRFYRKDEPNKAISISEEERAYIVPEEFQHQFLRVYCTSTDVNADRLKEMKGEVKDVLQRDEFKKIFE